MTDIEQNRIKAICEVAGVKEIEDLSDGYHTFKQLYYQRMMLFATIVKQNKDKAWKSLRHEDGELCFGGGWFIVGIDTPEGSYTYHYEDKYFNLFDCEELERAKHWDGHTEKDVTRLLSLEHESKWILVSEGSEGLPKENGWYQCTVIFYDSLQTMELFYKNGKWLDNRRIDMFNAYDIYGYGNTKEKHKLSYQELISEFDWTENVIAWKPLSGPYISDIDNEKIAESE